MSDLKEESSPEGFQQELECASGAVQSAFTAYVDLLEDLRRANEEQLATYNDERLEHATNLKQLRQDLDQIVQNA